MPEDESVVFKRRLFPPKRWVRQKKPVLDYEESPSRFHKGPPMDGRTKAKFNNWVGRLAEQYIEKQTGDINNVNPGWIRRFEFDYGAKIAPDSVDFCFGEPPVLGDVKVGTFSSLEDAEALANIVQRKAGRPGIIYLLESPITTRSKAAPGVKKLLAEVGFSLVYFRGPWWDALQGPEPVPGELA